PQIRQRRQIGRVQNGAAQSRQADQLEAGAVARDTRVAQCAPDDLRNACRRRDREFLVALRDQERLLGASYIDAVGMPAWKWAEFVVATMHAFQLGSGNGRRRAHSEPAGVPAQEHRGATVAIADAVVATP